MYGMYLGMPWHAGVSELMAAAGTNAFMVFTRARSSENNNKCSTPPYKCEKEVCQQDKGRGKLLL